MNNSMTRTLQQYCKNKCNRISALLQAHNTFHLRSCQPI